MIICLLCLIVNGIAITVGISHAYASVPITLGLVVYVLAINYECKNILAMGDANRPESYFSVGFGSLKSIHTQTVDWLLPPPQVQAIPVRTP